MESASRLRSVAEESNAFIALLETAKKAAIATINRKDDQGERMDYCDVVLKLDDAIYTIRKHWYAQIRRAAFLEEASNARAVDALILPND